MIHQEVIRTINQMQSGGIIDRSAISGTVEAAFHPELVSRLDVDIFDSFRSKPGSLLISPQPASDNPTSRVGGFR